MDEKVMPTEYIKLYQENLKLSKVDHIANVIKKGGIVIYPTDTVYGLGCDIFNRKAIEKIKKLKGITSKTLSFSFICYDLSHLAEYAKVATPTFKLMKKCLPGPYTFLLEATQKVPKILSLSKKGIIGIRIPNHNIPRELVNTVGNPIITTSLPLDDSYGVLNDPEVIYKKYKNKVDIVIDGGMGELTPSTIIDCSDDDHTVVREGLGDIAFLS